MLYGKRKAAIKRNDKGHHSNRLYLGAGPIHPLHRVFKNQNDAFQLKIINKINQKMDIILTVVYVLCIVVIFWLFFKTVNFFENI